MINELFSSRPEVSHEPVLRPCVECALRVTTGSSVTATAVSTASQRVMRRFATRLVAYAIRSLSSFRALSRRALQTLRLSRLSAFSFSPQAVVSTR